MDGTGDIGDMGSMGHLDPKARAAARRRAALWRRRALPAIGLALVLVMTACGGDETASDEGAGAPDTGGSAEATSTEQEQAGAESPPAGSEEATSGETMGGEATGGEASEGASPPQAGGDAATVAVASTDLGEIIVDADGMTLYMFMPDEQGPSTCYDSCAGNWPPILGEPVAGEGVDESLLGTVERNDGSVQVTYGGWPLYLFAGDSAPGDVNGQGVGDNWYVMDAEGQIVEAAAGEQGGATPSAAAAGDEEDY